jgi:hypothetical protein
MCPVKNWDEVKDNFSDLKFIWREIDTGVDLGGSLATKSILQKSYGTVFAGIRNRDNMPITANFYVGIDPKSKQDCGKATTEIIEAGQVWYQIFNIPLKTRKQNKVGVHKMGFYTELRNAKQTAKKVARVALATFTGIKVGKIHGISLEFKVVGQNAYKCPKCNNFLTYRPLEKGKSTLFWVCETCRQNYTI